MTIVMGLDQHRAQITAEWMDTETGEVTARANRLDCPMNDQVCMWGLHCKEDLAWIHRCAAGVSGIGGAGDRRGFE